MPLAKLCRHWNRRLNIYYKSNMHKQVRPFNGVISTSWFKLLKSDAFNLIKTLCTYDIFVSSSHTEIEYIALLFNLCKSSNVSILYVPYLVEIDSIFKYAVFPYFSRYSNLNNNNMPHPNKHIENDTRIEIATNIDVSLSGPIREMVNTPNKQINEKMNNIIILESALHRRRGDIIKLLNLLTSRRGLSSS